MFPIPINPIQPIGVPQQGVFLGRVVTVQAVQVFAPLEAPKPPLAPEKGIDVQV